MTAELSGVDLARQALVAAREAAKKSGATTKKPQRRTTTVVRRDGREPLGLGSAISRMMTERGMVAPAAGGSVLADFDSILAAVVPELAGRVKAVAFDAETGCLDVVPDTLATGTRLRWSAPKLVAAANERVRGANVRALHVLAPASMKAGPAVSVADPVPQPPVPVVPVERRTPPDGYRRAIEAHRRAAMPSRVDPGITEAVERQNRAMRELSRLAYPEPPAVPDDAPAPIGQARAQRRRQAAVTEAAALRRAAPPAPVRTELAQAVQPAAPRPRNPGYLVALAAHQEHRNTRDADCPEPAQQGPEGRGGVVGRTGGRRPRCENRQADRPAQRSGAVRRLHQDVTAQAWNRSRAPMAWPPRSSMLLVTLSRRDRATR
ncbi:DUF721 domain-containing protein [Streptomyces sp. NPDC020965]|uniref:DUF721 domain-containing protein n=1 Tax=Streptomyces sp. NPDC020965 TaxID=3365105 RepID=UPI0037BDB797